jgi:hypothetical protein
MTGSTPIAPRPAPSLPGAFSARVLPILAALVLLLAGCSATPASKVPAAPAPPVDQAAASPAILAAAATIGPGDDAARICAAMRYVGEHLAFDPFYNHEQFTKTASDLFSDRILGGCSDFALAELALFRALGFQARLALTANIFWITRWRENELATGYGHSFIEVFLDGRWRLADPTHFVLYDDYDPTNKNLPSGEILIARGRDFGDIGIASVDSAKSMLVQAAKTYADDYRDPSLPVLCRVDFDFPATFTRLGEIFLEKGPLSSARRLCRKAAELDPSRTDAWLCLAKAHLQAGDQAKAATALAQAERLAPASPEVRSLRQKIPSP